MLALLLALIPFCAPLSETEDVVERGPLLAEDTTHDCPTCKGSGRRVAGCVPCAGHGSDPCRQCNRKASLERELAAARAKVRTAEDEAKIAELEERCREAPEPEPGYVLCTYKGCDEGKTANGGECRFCRGKPRRRCEDCKRGKVRCKHCKGSKTQKPRCIDCLGRGKITVGVDPSECKFCDGDRFRTCPGCPRKGATEDCLGCSGKKTEICIPCLGSGKLRCSPCTGRGSIMQGGQWKKCKTCSGKGTSRCERCKKGRVECRRCEGKGKQPKICWSCLGTKKVSCPGCTGHRYVFAAGRVHAKNGKPELARTFFEEALNRIDAAYELAGSQKETVQAYKDRTRKGLEEIRREIQAEMDGLEPRKKESSNAR